MSSGTKTGPAGGTGPAAHASRSTAPATGAGTGTDVPRGVREDEGRNGGAGEGDRHEGGVRARVDELDRRIIALVQERRAVTAGGRRAAGDAGAGQPDDASARREGDGGLAREMEILKRYRRELGRPGTQLAMTLLSLSRV